MVIPYVPVTEPVADARQFFEAWGRS
jgi:hypothetical protein